MTRFAVILLLLGVVYSQDVYKLRNTNVQKIPSADMKIKSYRFGIDNQEYFHLLDVVNNFAFIGAKNAVFSINFDILHRSPEVVMNWSSNAMFEPKSELIRSANFSGNYIRLLVFLGPDKVIACGTNSGSPKCRFHVKGQDGVYKITDERGGRGIIPYNADQLFTYTYSQEKLFIGSPLTSSADRGQIYATPLLRDSTSFSNDYVTTSYDYSDIDHAEFVSSFEYGDHIYFIFRENSLEEFNSNRTSTRSKYTRIGRMCKNDKGSKEDKKRISTFLKVRPICAPKERPGMNSNTIESAKLVTHRVEGRKESSLYMIFTHSEGSNTFSTFCVAKMSEIENLFKGKFYRKPVTMSEVNFVPEKVTRIQEGFCPLNNSFLSDNEFQFLKNHQLSDVKAMENVPLVSTRRYKFVKMAVSSEVVITTARSLTVVYLLTTNGKIVKISQDHTKMTSQQLKVIAKINLPRVYRNSTFVNFEVVKNSTGDHQLLLVMKDAVIKLSTHRCSIFTTCTSCLAEMDPYCAWHLHEKRCRPVEHPVRVYLYVQELNFGNDAECPPS